jgi:hypothetical protein
LAIDEQHGRGMISSASVSRVPGPRIGCVVMRTLFGRHRGARRARFRFG